MRFLLPTRKFSLYSFFIVFCIGGGLITWDQRYKTPFEEQLPFILFLAIFFWAALYLLGSEILHGPLVYLYGEQRKFEIPLQSAQTIGIGPFYTMAGNFLLIDMAFELPKDNANTMRSFRLHTSKKNHNEKIVGWIELCAGDLGEEGEVLKQAKIDWSLHERNNPSNMKPVFELELLVPGENQDAHYLIISPLKMKRAFPATADNISQDNLSVEVILRVGFGTGKLLTSSRPSLQNAEMRLLD